MTTRAKSHALGLRLITVGFALLSSDLCSASPPWYTPTKGSNERAQIMDALRAHLATFDVPSKALIFVVKEICVSPTAGWLSVEPQSRDGKNRLESVQASFKRGKSGWRVETLACGEEDCPKGTDPKALRDRVKPRCESLAE